MQSLSSDNKRELILQRLRETNEGVFPLSPAQERLWITDQIAGKSPEYNEPIVVRLEGIFRPDALQSALADLVKRHSVLRSNFITLDGHPRVLIAVTNAASLRQVDLTETSDEDQNTEVMRTINDEVFRPFDLTQGPLWRACLVKLAVDHNILIFTVHHIVTDEWSRAIAIRDLLTFYDARSQGEIASLPPLQSQYWDYAVWQRKWMEGSEAFEQCNYWKKQLAGLPILTLPYDKPRPSVPSHRGGTVFCKLPIDLSRRIREFGRTEKTTLFMTLLTAFQILLWRYSGQEDFPIGAPITNRVWPQLEGTLGSFVNLLVLRAHLAGRPSFREVLARVRHTTLDAYDNRAFPFGKLVDELQHDRDLSRQSLFQVSFLLQEQPIAVPQTSTLKIQHYPFVNPTCKFDLTFGISSKDQLEGSWEYALDLFNQDTVEQMAMHYERLLDAMTKDPERCINDVPLVTMPDRDERLDNATRGQEKTHTIRTCLSALFDAQVSRAPEARAVSLYDETLTYGQLNSRANQLANYLISSGAVGETIVAICLDRSIEMVISILGVLKAGAAYVPLDPAYPQDLLAYIVKDSRAGIVVTRSDRLEQLGANHGVLTICLDRDHDKIAAGGDATPLIESRPDNLAYILYTSGSTGKPKGVLVSHHNVVRLLEETQDLFHFDSSDVWTLFHSYAFDFSVWEMWGALAFGGRLVIVPYNVSRTPNDFRRLVYSERVTIMNQTPSAFGEYIRASEETPVDEPLRLIIFGGEALNVEALRPWMETHGDQSPQLINMYGITETTVHVTYRRIAMDDLRPSVGSVIGQPLPDLQVFVLDADYNPVPRGVAGEVYVAGPGLSRGYHGKPDLTAERFLPNPWGGAPGERMYRTGDRARRVAEGDLEFLGRLDDQVKIRGFRIELGEVEATLTRHPAVKQAVVTAWNSEGADRRLAAYVVPKAVDEPTGSDVYRLANGLAVAQANKNETEFLYQDIFQRSSYFRHGIGLKEDACVLDIGANIGLFSMFVAECCPSAKCYSFEPIPALFEKLVRNVQRYGGRVRPFQLGMAAFDGDLEFTYYPRYSMMSGLKAYTDSEKAGATVRQYLRNQELLGEAAAKELRHYEDDLLAGRFSGETISCKVQRLSHFIKEQDLLSIDLLKIDVEGAESDVLAGLDIEDWDRIGQVVMEVHGSRCLESCLQILEGAGFEVCVDQDPSLESTEILNLYAWNRSNSQRFKSEFARQSVNVGPPLDESDVRSYLRSKLPDYMIPSAIVIMDDLPVTPNGKVDRRHLPPPDEATRKFSRTKIAPKTDLEQNIAHAWRQVLEVETIGVEDNFFDVGGNSLSAIRAHRQLVQTVSADLTVIDLFTYPTIRALADHLSSSIDQPDEAVSQERLTALETGRNRVNQQRALHRADAGIQLGP